MKKTLKATQEFFYGGKTLKEGEKFEAVDPDANILVCLGKATEASADPIPEAPKIETAEMRPTPPERAARPDGRRRYARRDMTAEE